MNQEHLNRLDFKNGQLEKWLNECPFPITNFRQICFETEGQKQVELLLDIPIEQTTVNLDHYGLKLDQKTADLEMQFIKIDRERKACIAAVVKSRKQDNPLKTKKLEDELFEIHKKWRDIGDQLTTLSKKAEKL